MDNRQRNTIRIIAAGSALCGALLGAAVVLALGLQCPSAPASPAPAVQIEEDSPMWDCRTMGNRICGPVELHTVTA